jgi:serine/threonine protein phosphatase PrpC
VRLRYAALSDVGRVRRDNQDSGYAGPNLLVIADGVGGSARGDIASAATVDTLRKLDQPQEPRDGEHSSDDVLGALAGAIHRSHDRIAGLVAENPEIEGTSTTVTAVVFDGTHLGVGHVGDSRGYLFRDGNLSQLTTDHTFVQSLIDEGRITADEARVHPHRNLILRAVDGVHEPEPDVFTLPIAAGDRILLCSDGCSGVLSDDELARLLTEGSPDEAASALVQASLEAGSSDNVTVVVADVVDGDADGKPGPLVVGAAAEPPRRRGLARLGRADTGELEPVEGEEPDELDPEAMRYAPRPPRRFTWVRRLVALALVLIVIGLIGFAGYKWSQTQYYVADSAGTVAIFRGIEADVPGIRTHHVEERSALRLDDLPSYNQRQVRDGISASDLEDARGIISRLQRLVPCPPSPSPSPKASGKASPGPSATTKPRAGNRTATPRPSATPSATPSASPSTSNPLCSETP